MAFHNFLKMFQGLLASIVDFFFFVDYSSFDNSLLVLSSHSHFDDS